MNQKVTLREARISGGSVVVTLTDFVQNGEQYIVRKTPDGVCLKKFTGKEV